MERHLLAVSKRETPPDSGDSSPLTTWGSGLTAGSGDAEVSGGGGGGVEEGGGGGGGVEDGGGGGGGVEDGGGGGGVDDGGGGAGFGVDEGVLDGASGFSSIGLEEAAGRRYQL